MYRRLTVLSPPRPQTRADCETCPTCQEWRDKVDDRTPHTLACGHTTEQAIWRSRPCLFVGCTHSLYLDVHPKTGEIKHNFAILPEEMADSCVLDVAEQGETTLDVVGAKLGVTRERARQIEAQCMEVLKKALTANTVTQLLPETLGPDIEESIPNAPLPEPTVEFTHTHLSRGAARRAYMAAQASAIRLVFNPAPVLRLVQLLALTRARRTTLQRFARATQ